MQNQIFKYLILLIIFHGIIVGQTTLSSKLYDKYSAYLEKEIVNKRFSHSDLMKILSKYENSNLIKITTAGYSLEGREIKLIKIGNGPTNVMAWSQMHGDESTATMALLDFLKFIENDDEFSEDKRDILENITLYIIPMLNPDGVERFRRRNALDIDINRDALRLQFPESKILRRIQLETKPKFAFNLHDQSTRYTAGKAYKVATISFLAPAYNYEKEINTVRKNAMKLISELTGVLDDYIPGHIAKYNDDFEPRAFGDNFMKWGSSLVLIESGGWKNNYEKSFVRKINFMAFVAGLESIAKEGYEKFSTSIYEEIPENQKLLFDLLLRNVQIVKDEKKYLIDIGINQNEISTKNKRDYFFKGKIEEIGDLSTFYGYDEIDCNGMTVDTANIFPSQFGNLEDLSKSNLTQILSEGYSFVQVDSINTKESFTTFPINVLKTGTKINNKFSLGNLANFVLKEDEKINLICVNGFLYDLRSGKNYIQNGLIIK